MATEGSTDLVVLQQRVLGTFAAAMFARDFERLARACNTPAERSLFFTAFFGGAVYFDRSNAGVTKVTWMLYQTIGAVKNDARLTRETTSDDERHRYMVDIRRIANRVAGAQVSAFEDHIIINLNP